MLTVMAKGKLKSEGNRAQILLLYSQGVSNVKLARELKCSRNAVITTIRKY